MRERKKAKTRAAIQHEALRLFRLQGYETTTVEQIADAAEISPSTFFRYFPSKEHVVLGDGYDPLIIAAIAEQPTALSPIQAVRQAFQAVFRELSTEELDDMQDRARLALAVPALRSATLDQLTETVRQISRALVPRIASSTEEFAVEVLAGAIVGVMISAQLYWAAHPDRNLPSLLDDALQQLERGLAR